MAILRSDRLCISLATLASLFVATQAATYSTPQTYNGNWTLSRVGTTGVGAMQLTVVDDDSVLIVDKVEKNPLQIDGHPAWSAVYTPSTQALRAVNLTTNSFCAGGGWLSNGTMLNAGGDATLTGYTKDGRQALRLYNPCTTGDCNWYEDPNLKMGLKRWYPTLARLADGSQFIMGGSIVGSYINYKSVNNPTLEYFPRKNIAKSNGKPIQSQFLVDTLNSNLFPIVFTIPGDKLFVAANNQSMIYDWVNNVETRLPGFPNGVRVTYPMTSSALLLPLTPENNYTPEVLICGGSTAPDNDIKGSSLSSQTPASAQCVRMVLTDAGIAAGWQVEQMPEARIMPDLVLTPGGQVLIVNGGKTGVAGYGNVANQVGASNADNPAFQGLLYDPNAPSGSRFSPAGIPASTIARLYHSVATLLPTGDFLIAGSNPNRDVSTKKYATEYRIERLSPPYMQMTRPSYSALPTSMAYGDLITLSVNLPNGTQYSDIGVVLMDLGFISHSVHMSSRTVGLRIVSLSDDASTMVVQAPPSPQLYPPGPGWLYVIANGIPSTGQKIMMGQGLAPPVAEPTVVVQPQTTGTGVWQSTASGTTVVVTTATSGAACGYATGTSSVCAGTAPSCQGSNGVSTCGPTPTTAPFQTTGTGIWSSTASSTTIVITTASIGGRCYAAFGTRTVCATPSASCARVSSGYSTCQTVSATSTSSITSTSTITSTPVATTSYQTTGTGTWYSSNSLTTIQIRTANSGDRCGAARGPDGTGTRTVCQTPAATCTKAASANYSTCSPAASAAATAASLRQGVARVALAEPIVAQVDSNNGTVGSNNLAARRHRMAARRASHW